MIKEIALDGEKAYLCTSGVYVFVHEADADVPPAGWVPKTRRDILRGFCLVRRFEKVSGAIGFFEQIGTDLTRSVLTRVWGFGETTGG